MVVFMATPPNVGMGAIKAREAPQLYNTEKEHTLRQPEDPFFKKFASECSRAQICLDLFTFTFEYSDLASLATVPRFLCG